MDQTLTIERNAQIDDTDKYTYQSFGSEYECNLQNPNPEELQLLDGMVGKNFNLFVKGDCPIETADRVTISGTKYTVKAVKVSTWGSMPYKMAQIIKQDGN